MNEYERQIFNGKCPYTSIPCDTDVDCGDCEVNEQEREDMKALDKAESEE